MPYVEVDDNSLIERVARALYESNQFAKDWDHPHINPRWHDIYRRQAKVAVALALETAAKVAEEYRPTFRPGEPMFANIASSIRALDGSDYGKEDSGESRK